MFADQITAARVRNPDARGDLELVILLDCNTSSETVNANIRANAARDDLPWLAFRSAHEGVAVIVGGGPSAADHLGEIKRLKGEGAFVMALNGASAWLRAHGIAPDCQCMIDARFENITLLDRETPWHLFASQVDPALLSVKPTLMHLLTAGVEDCLPAERRARGDYALLGGGYGVGNTAICAAFVLGYRTLHCFGFDSSHRDGRGHAYAQPMNEGEATVETEWDGATYTSSLAMKAHAERFQIIASDLEHSGCAVHVHGDGLLPAMWRMRGKQMAERSKYHLLWSTGAYRAFAPGEHIVGAFLDAVRPDGVILDLGCGTGRASVALHRRGYEVVLVDFAENCRDPAALSLPFFECDLTEPLPVRGDYGFCTDVMEHIPTEDVGKVLANMFAAAPRIFFQIDTAPDSGGALIGHTLHMNVEGHDYWREMLTRFGRIAFEEQHPHQSIFYVIKEEA